VLASVIKRLKALELAICLDGTDRIPFRQLALVMYP